MRLGDDAIHVVESKPISGMDHDGAGTESQQTSRRHRQNAEPGPVQRAADGRDHGEGYQQYLRMGQCRIARSANKPLDRTYRLLYFVEMAKGDALGEFEQIVLLVILRLREDAYGMTVTGCGHSRDRESGRRRLSRRNPPLDGPGRLARHHRRSGSRARRGVGLRQRFRQSSTGCPWPSWPRCLQSHAASGAFPAPA